MGADDYITKPFSQRLLIERIRALLRRRELAKDEANPSSDSVLARGDLIMDGARHLGTWKGKPVPLTVTEFLILRSLATRPGHVKNRDQLMMSRMAMRFMLMTGPLTATSSAFGRSSKKR